MDQGQDFVLSPRVAHAWTPGPGYALPQVLLQATDNAWRERAEGAAQPIACTCS